MGQDNIALIMGNKTFNEEKEKIAIVIPSTRSRGDYLYARNSIKCTGKGEKNGENVRDKRKNKRKNL